MATEDIADRLDDLICTFDDVVGNSYDTFLFVFVGWLGLAALVYYLATKALKKPDDLSGDSKLPSAKKVEATMVPPPSVVPLPVVKKTAAAAAAAPQAIAANGCGSSNADANATYAVPEKKIAAAASGSSKYIL